MRIKFQMKTTKEEIFNAHSTLVKQYEERDSSFMGWHPTLEEDGGVWTWKTWTSGHTYTTSNFTDWTYEGAQNGFFCHDWWYAQSGRETIVEVCGTYGTFRGANALEAYTHQKVRFVEWYEKNRYRGESDWYVIQAKAAEEYRGGMRSPFCHIERLARTSDELVIITELTHKSPAITLRRMAASGLRIR